MEGIDPKNLLEAEFLARKQKNPSYSLRAFANLLEIPSGRVSQLLSRKRRFTRKIGQKIAQRLNFDPQKTDGLLRSIDASRNLQAATEKSSSAYRALDMDAFQSIADPVHFALLSLAETRGFQSDIGFISKRLGISRTEARSAIDRLLRLGLLKREKGRISLAREPGLTTSHDIQSAALRESHKKVLDHAKEAIDLVAVELRDITSMTMAIDPGKLPEAKARLKAFRRSFSEFMESGQQQEVYRLNIQLVPVTKEGKGKR